MYYNNLRHRTTRSQTSGIKARVLHDEGSTLAAVGRVGQRQAGAVRAARRQQRALRPAAIVLARHCHPDNIIIQHCGKYTQCIPTYYLDMTIC